MNIHEYQAKEIFKKFGITVPNGVAIFSLDEISNLYFFLGISLLFKNFSASLIEVPLAWTFFKFETETETVKVGKWEGPCFFTNL